MSVRDPGSDQDDKVKALEAVRSRPEGMHLTTDQETPVSHTDDSLRPGPRGPTLLEDFHFREKLTRFDHERIPERVVHARGSGAHGYFQAYEPLTRYTKAKSGTRRRSSRARTRTSTAATSGRPSRRATIHRRHPTAPPLGPGRPPGHPRLTPTGAARGWKAACRPEGALRGWKAACRPEGAARGWKSPGEAGKARVSRKAPRGAGAVGQRRAARPSWPIRRAGACFSI
ncbi:catalase [Sorangium sp. So ce296]